ncbi:MAG: hypothetical protein JWQ09_2496 [Segetibacter sp.]|nr:hypothetical protein [Segetibacter sp.]
MNAQVNRLPATAMIQASIIAEVKDLTSNPEKNLSVIFITIANTISRTKNESRKNVNRFKGNLSIAPIVAFKMPITSATKTAVPKLFILTVGIIFDANNNTAALINNCNIQPIFFVFNLFNNLF